MGADYRVDAELLRAHGLAALTILAASAVFGIAVSLQFFLPDLTSGWPALGWGRLRFAHTQGIMLGWLGNAFFAFLYHAVPVSTGRAVTSRRLGFWLFGIWNFAVMLPGWILVLGGVSQPLEWAEFPLVVDGFAILGLAMAAVQFLPPFFRRGLDSLYVSSWYVIGALIFTLLAFPMGNLVPEFVPGAAGAAFSGLWIHDAVGLFVTPLALAILYFVIPASTGRPIFSHFLSMFGFWGLFFLYPLNGTHHYIYSVIPMGAQLSAIAASALLGFIVVVVVSNLLLSLRGAGVFPRDVGLRFVVMSTIFYLIVSLQGSVQAQMRLNQAVHFTDWVIGHSHLAMLGFASFAGIGGLIHAWQRLPAARYNARALDWAYWLLLFGVGFMVVDLTVAGLVEARLWQSQAPWLESIRAARPYWMLRTLSAAPIVCGFVLLIAGLCTGPVGAGAKVIEAQRGRRTAAEPSPEAARLGMDALAVPRTRPLRMAYAVASLAGIAFFFMSVALLGVWPKRVLDAETNAMSPANALGLTASEKRGRAIYAREGCAYCHTQQIRYVEADVLRFGAPSLAWETQFDYPQLFGTRRIGPDLFRAGASRSEDWHYAHLYDPRSVVPLSIMPAYPWLFERTATQPTQEARDLVGYLESLGRAREIAWPDGDLSARAAAADSRWIAMAFEAPRLNAHPARTRPRGGAPSLGAPASAETGSRLWAEHCAGCHGVDGRGDGPATDWLEPRPTNLAEHDYSRARLTDVLWNGVLGTSMPAWRDLAAPELAALAETVRRFGPSPAVAAAGPEDLETGRRVYLTHCAECHGRDGDGRGFAADRLPIAPTDFRAQRPSLTASLAALRSGVPGTAMAPWSGRLDEAELLAVAQYLRQLFDGGDSALERRD